MSERLDDDLPQVDQLETLKARADQMGLSYHPNIGAEKLRERIAAALASDGPLTSEEEETHNTPQATSEAKTKAPVFKETDIQRRLRMKREAQKLVRIRVACMNPAKKEWEGEIFTVGNSVVGSHTKYVPFNVDEGWHVPHIIYKHMKERKCQVFFDRRTKDGDRVREGKLISEFNIEVLPPLTPEELKELARRQAAARSIE